MKYILPKICTFFVLTIFLFSGCKKEATGIPLTTSDTLYYNMQYDHPYNICIYKGSITKLISQYTQANVRWSTGETSLDINVKTPGKYIVYENDMPVDSVVCDYCEYALSIPNSFTPNYDAFNDLFTVEGFGIKYITMSIFNAESKLVFSANNISQWDGKNCNPGLYYYYIKCTFLDNSTKEYTGTVKLVR